VVSNEPVGAGWELPDEGSPCEPFERPAVNWNGLGDGWQHAEQVLALVQADLSRTLPDAPELGFAWYDQPQVDRAVFVGKGPDWVFGANGPLHRRSGIADAAAELAEAVQDAIVDSLLGYRSFWPTCRRDGGPLTAEVSDGKARWSCRSHGHEHGAVGELRLEA
jgi:hypothetical protein